MEANETLPGDVAPGTVVDTSEEVSAVEVQNTAEAADEAAALAVLKGARTAPADEPTEEAVTPPGEAAKPAEAKVEVKPTPPIPEQPKADQSEVLLQRLNTLEANHRNLAAENKVLRDKASVADKWTKLAQGAAEGDQAALDGVFGEMGWTVETLVKYIEQGKDGIKPALADKKVDAVSDRIAKLEAELAKRDAETQVREYKSTVSSEVVKLSADVPFLVNDFTDPETGVVNHAAIADAVFDLQYRLHHSEQPRDISVQDATKLLNKVREDQFKRLQGKKQADPTPAAAPAKLSATPAPTQAPVVKKTRVAIPVDKTADPDLDDALATLKSFRTKRQDASVLE